MSEKPETRYIFINSVLEFVEQTKVDGVDLDWEFPGYDWVDSGGALSLKPNRPEDKGFFLNCSLNYGLHLSENQKQYLLAITTSPLSEITSAIDLRAIAKQVDFINIMAYDFYMSWLLFPIQFTGHQSNLFDTAGNP